MFTLVITLVLSLVSGTVLAAGPIDKLVVGNWSGGSYSDDKTGSFSYCMASTSYKSGILFSVAVTKKFQWDLIFFHPEWKLSTSEKIPLTMVFDRTEKFDFQASAISPTMVMVPMPDNSRLVNVFRRSIAMKAYAKGNEFQFRLDGTSRLIPALVQCTKDGISKYATSNSRETANSNNSTGDLKQPQLDLESLRLGSNFLLNSQIDNAKMLSREDLPEDLKSYNSAWKGNGISGAVKILPADANKGIEIATRAAVEDAAECKGKFSSGQASEQIDGEDLFRSFSICDEPKSSSSSHYFVLHRKKEPGFVLFAVKTTGVTMTEKDEKIIIFKRAAFRAIQ